METDLPEAVIGGERDSRRHDAATGTSLVDPVADVGAQQGASRDPTDGDLTGEGAIDDKCEGQAAPLVRLGPKPTDH